MPTFFSRWAQCRVCEGNIERALGPLNRILVLRPDHDRVRFELAISKNRLGNSAGAAADLLDYLRSPNPDRDDTLRPSKIACNYVPGRVEEAVDLPAVQALDDDTKLSEVYPLLSDTDTALEWAIQVAHRMLANPVREMTEIAFLFVSLLMQARRWKEAIEFLQTKSIEALSGWELFAPDCLPAGRTTGNTEWRFMQASCWRELKLAIWSLTPNTHVGRSMVSEMSLTL